MSYQDEDPLKQLSIDISVSLGVAAQLAVADQNNDPLDAFIGAAEVVVREHQRIKATLLAEAGLGAREVPAASVPAPTYTPPAQAAPAPQQPAYVPAAAPAPQPAPIPGVADGDPQVAAMWQELVNAWNAGALARDFRSARDGQWFDNRAGKSATAPDFKVKGPKGSQTPALWINDKKNPSWVAQFVATIG